LDGEEKVPGLAMDTDLRWHFLVALAEGGMADEDEIVAEVERDPTDIGARRGATARASRPDPEAKAAAWTAVLNDEDLTLAMKRAIVVGFFRPAQDELLRPYVERFPEAVAAAWTDRDIEESLLITEGLYPSTIIDESVIAIADQVLAGDRLPAPARRLVSESRDGTLRALRARAADAA